MEKLLPILTYFLASMFLTSCSSDCDTCELLPSKFRNFDTDRVIGKSWRVHSITPLSFADNWTCWTNRFYKSCNGSYYLHTSFTNESFCGPDQMRAALQFKEGNIIDMKFPQNSDWNYPYYVYGTDYETYVVMGGCPEVMRPMAWTMYNSWTPTEAAQKAAKSVLKKYGLDQYEYARDCTNIPKQ